MELCRVFVLGTAVEGAAGQGTAQEVSELCEGAEGVEVPLARPRNALESSLESLSVSETCWWQWDSSTGNGAQAGSAHV